MVRVQLSDMVILLTLLCTNTQKVVAFIEFSEGKKQTAYLVITRKCLTIMRSETCSSEKRSCNYEIQISDEGVI